MGCIWLFQSFVRSINWLNDNIDSNLFLVRKGKISIFFFVFPLSRIFLNHRIHFRDDLFPLASHHYLRYKKKYVWNIDRPFPKHKRNILVGWRLYSPLSIISSWVIYESKSKIKQKNDQFTLLPTMNTNVDIVHILGYASFCQSNELLLCVPLFGVSFSMLCSWDWIFTNAKSKIIICIHIVYVKSLTGIENSNQIKSVTN